MDTSPQPQPRGPYAKSERFRLYVLDAALTILAERGFDATTLQLIADEVGRSKAGLLHHFGSRDALMQAIVEHRDTVNHRLFPAGPGLEASVRLVEHNATVPGLVALFAVTSALAASDPESTGRRDFFQERYARTRDGFTRTLAAAQAASTIRSDQRPEVLATLFIAAMDGLQIQWLLDPAIDMATHLRAMVTLLDPC